ncbi:hypothetical protein [Microcystis aeruginosa]|uniref:Uncharacterized protein n=1 Tax=Microcystis aeruginosa PCC 9701 TaxID=721123 RepID=I4INV1_MICAE|nr:hypothetical protein [Microcystis aeruginosa]CCI35975.1 conserved hypothetical protein [Microcystis aeruginosa PCC 9701]
MTLTKNIKQIVKATPIGQLYRQLSEWRTDSRKKAYFSKNLDLYSRILSAEQANKLLADKVASDEPLMISRLGNVELGSVLEYLTGSGSYSKYALERMLTSTGFFMSEQEDLDNYSKLFLESSKLIDILGVWFQPGEAEVIRQSCPEADLVNLPALEPYYHDNPWSIKLKDRKVLVIHPFASTISEQYRKHREVLFKNQDILPQFELITLKSVQSIPGTRTDFNTWFDAYDWMRDKIKQYDFDIAIIGCGAYGLPLAAYVKSLGKKAVHLGGATQILFGIRGKRWDERPFFQSLYNQYWVRPSSEETPESYIKVEDGCYW